MFILRVSLFQNESEFWEIISTVSEAYKGIHDAITKELREEKEKEAWRNKRAKAKSMTASGGPGVSFKPVKYTRTGYGTCPIHDEPVRFEPWEGAEEGLAAAEGAMAAGEGSRQQPPSQPPSQAPPQEPAAPPASASAGANGIDAMNPILE